MVGSVLVPLLVQGVVQRETERGAICRWTPSRLTGQKFFQLVVSDAHGHADIPPLFAGCAFSDVRDYLNPVNFLSGEWLFIT